MKLTPYHAKYIAHELTRRCASDKYTNRHALVQEFVPTPDEQRLYDVVSEYLQQPTRYPASRPRSLRVSPPRTASGSTRRWRSSTVGPTTAGLR